MEADISSLTILSQVNRQFYAIVMKLGIKVILGSNNYEDVIICQQAASTVDTGYRFGWRNVKVYTPNLKNHNGPSCPCFCHKSMRNLEQIVGLKNIRSGDYMKNIKQWHMSIPRVDPLTSITCMEIMHYLCRRIRKGDLPHLTEVYVCMLPLGGREKKKEKEKRQLMEDMLVDECLKRGIDILCIKKGEWWEW